MQKQKEAGRKPKFIEQMRSFMRARRYSLRTEQAYLDWVRRFILFHAKRHPREMAETEIVEFLTHLATQRNVAASTQNQHVKASLTCLGRLTSILCSMSMCY